MERSVTVAVLVVCVVFTALVTALIFMAITCCTIRMRRFDILYQIEKDQRHAKIKELDMQEFETKAAERRAKAAGYGSGAVEGMAPYYQIDLRGNLEKKVKSDQEEADRKANRKSGWFGTRTIADAAAPAVRMTNQERIQQQLDSHRKLQDEQLQASYARFNSTMTGKRTPGEMQQFDFGTGEMRSQATELEFLSNRRTADDILPIPGRSPKTSPPPSTLGSPKSMISMNLSSKSREPSMMTLNGTPSMSFRRTDEPPRPPHQHQRQNSHELRSMNSEGRIQSATRSRPGTPGTIVSLNLREERPRMPESSPSSHSLRYNSMSRNDGGYNPNHML
jgi:hypothetical protein